MWYMKIKFLHAKKWLVFIIFCMPENLNVLMIERKISKLFGSRKKKKILVLSRAYL